MLTLSHHKFHYRTDDQRDKNDHACSQSHRRRRNSGDRRLDGRPGKRLTRLSSVTRREVSGASGDVGDFVSEALSRITNRVRETAAEASHSVADEVSRFGTDAFKKLTDEVEQRPLIMLAVAAGIGFLAGLANRR